MPKNRRHSRLPAEHRPDQHAGNHWNSFKTGNLVNTASLVMAERFSTASRARLSPSRHHGRMVGQRAGKRPQHEKHQRQMHHQLSEREADHIPRP